MFIQRMQIMQITADYCFCSYNLIICNCDIRVNAFLLAPASISMYSYLYFIFTQSETYLNGVEILAKAMMDAIDCELPLLPFNGL